ncbi:hypothetical protein Acr_00g0096050 [Actinidia rufa]|uniref:Uncharacterized protein n=1 Tax=Actinidia rufa TaxID=165716 RepID=A0A7J0DYJ3_9ERIC|nr:hypothetical protein Acr_00g0095890 [Actinidia rufa]GFS45447.1 hypothetical protein Acr_00g0096050 [Actinidia rufa]
MTMSNDYKVVKIVHLLDSGAMIPPKIGELLIAAQRFLISYDPKAAQVKNLGIRSNTKVWCEYSVHTDTYTGSLALLGSPVQTEEAEVDWEAEEDGDEGSEEKEESDDKQYTLYNLI